MKQKNLLLSLFCIAFSVSTFAQLDSLDLSGAEATDNIMDEVNGPDKLIDGDLETRWHTSGETLGELLITLEAPTNIKELNFLLFNRENFTNAIEILNGDNDDVLFEGSTDPEKIGDGTPGVIEEWGWWKLELDEAVELSSIKLNVTGPGTAHDGTENTHNWFSAWEVKILTEKKEVPSGIFRANTNTPVSVYPNPAVNTVGFSLAPEFGTKINVEFISVTGQTVKTVEDFNANNLLNIEDLNSGIYVVRVSNTSNDQAIQTLVIQD